jgi:hypothetical protein
MIYLIGGASRAGKTYLAKRLMSMLNTPLLELDYLKMGFANGLPQYGIHPLQDEETIGSALWPVVAGMMRAMVENGHDYIIEGTYILPAYAVESQQRYGDVIRSCFLGYAHTPAAEKLAQLQGFGEDPDPSDIDHFVEFSKFLRSECPRLGLTYVEVADREEAVERGIRHLLQPQGQHIDG